MHPKNREFIKNLSKALEKITRECSEEAKQEMHTTLFLGCRKVQDKVKELHAETERETNLMRYAELTAQKVFYQRIYDQYIAALAEYVIGQA